MALDRPIGMRWSLLRRSALVAVLGSACAGPDDRALLADPSVERILDGASPTLDQPLAELALERAHLGANWLAGVVRDDGSFYYRYDPNDDEYEVEDYNEVRHAGTTYSLFQAYDALRDETILEAGEAGARYIDANSVEAGAGRAYLYEGRMKLGGQALALVALLERRRVMADSTYDDLIRDLADFMLAMELPDEPGRYFQSYEAVPAQLLLEPDSDFYPGEALLALTRLEQQFPDGPYLEYAVRAADYLIHRRDGDILAAAAIPRQDHWLTLALAELYRLEPDEDYRTVAYLQADDMLANQYAPDTPFPERIGASQLRSPINYTSTATKGEALVAAWALAEFADDGAASERFSAGARRNVQFQLRVQFTTSNVGLFPAPERLVGAWPEDAADPYVRIDFVQHNISALVGLWSMTEMGTLPIADSSG